MENTSPKQVFVSLIGLLVVLGCIYFFFRVFDLAQVERTIAQAGVWAPLVLILAKATTVVIAPLSGSPIYPVAGAVFGFWKALPLLILGDFLGGSVAFLLSRFFGRNLAEKLLGGHGNLISKALSMMGSVKGFLLVRLSFVTFPEIPAYAAGLSRIGYIPFILIYTAVGAFPTAIVAGLGAYLTRDSGSPGLGVVLFAGTIVSAISILLFLRMLGREVDNSPLQSKEAID